MPFSPSRIASAVLLCGVALIAADCSRASKEHYLANGDRLLAEGKLKEAIVEFRNAVKADDRSGEARYKLAAAYAQSGDAERAYAEYIRAADLMPEHTEAQFKAVSYLLAVGHYEDARTRTQQVLARDPKNAEALVLLATSLAGLKDLDAAVTQINEAIAIEPARSSAYSNLALIKIEQGKLKEAHAAFQKAIAADSSSVVAWLGLSNLYWSTGNIGETERALKRALELDPKHLLANRALGTLYVMNGRPEAAEPYLKTVAEQAKTTAASLMLADYYIRRNRPDDARRILEPLKARRAAADAAQIRLAGLVYVEGGLSDAHRAIDLLLSRDPNDAAALLLKARWLLAEGKPERALRFARRAVSANERVAASYYVRGLAEAETHRSADAVKSFTEVLRLNPRASLAQVHLSRLHLQRNAVDSAVLMAEEALRNSPLSVDARLALIRAWIARDDLNRASNVLRSLKTAAPNVPGVHALEGSLQLLLRNKPAARAAFEQTLKLDASSIDALRGLAMLDLEQGQGRLAVERLEQVIAKSSDVDLLFLTAQTYVADGQPTKAEELLRRIISDDPLHPEAFSVLGRLFAQQKRLDTALAEFDAAVAKDSSDIASRLMAAMIVHWQAKTAEAEKRYSEVLRLEPFAAIAANNLASIYADRRENLEVAQQLAETAASLLPANAEVLDTLGWIYYHRSLVGPAIRQFEQSIALVPKNAVFHYHLGLAHQRAGDDDRARRALGEALRLNPQFVDARVALESMKS